MPYYTINKKPVFLSKNKNKELKDIVKNNKNSEWKVSSSLQKTPESKVVDKFAYDLLEQKATDDPKMFNREWVHFDLKDEEAVENIWDLLYDWCHYYGHARLIDDRDWIEKLAADFDGELRQHPMGKIFYLTHFVKPHRWWWRYYYKMLDRRIQITINADRVTEAYGSLDNFVVQMGDLRIKCNKNLELTLEPKDQTHIIPRLVNPN